MRTRAMKGRDYALGGVLFILMVMCSGCGSLVANPEARQEIDKLNQHIKTMADKAVASAEKGEAIATQISELKTKIQEGAIDAAQATMQMQTLVAEGSALYQGFQQAQADIRVAQEKVKALQTEHGVPWWQIALNTGLAGLTAFAGSRWVRARTGIQVLTSAIEAGADQGEIKKRVSNANHPDVENAVRNG